MKTPSLLKRLPHSLEARIIASFIIILLVMATVLDVLFITIQKDTYTNDMQTHGFTMARMLAQSARTGVFSEDSDLLQEATNSLLDLERVHQIVIMTSTGKVLVSNRSPHHAKPHDIEPTETNWQEKLADVRHSNTLFWEDEDHFTFWWPVQMSMAYQNIEDLYFNAEEENNESIQEIGHVAIIIDKGYYLQGVRQILIRTGITIAILSILAIVCATLLTRHITTPLRQLLQKINPEEHGTAPDVDILEDTMLSLVENLDSSFTTINNLREGLEVTVAERTQELSQANEELQQQKANLETTLSELQNAQAQLVQSEKMVALGQVVAGVAHEINNTINFISASLPSLNRAVTCNEEALNHFIGTAQSTDATKQLTLLDEAQAFSKEHECAQNSQDIALLLHSISEGTKRTIQVVSALQAFSRSNEEGKFTSMSIADAVDSTLLFIDKHKRKNISIIRNYGDTPRVTCQIGSINQVFLNILNNAMQAMEGCGTLTITTRALKNRVQILFKDSGPGIPLDILPMIFDPFFTTKEVGQGTGLGLSISYRIVKDHQGEIVVTSKEGEGTTFAVSLPIEQV